MIASVLMMSLGLTAPTGHKVTGDELAESVEWLCARADMVVVGRIVSAVDLQGGGKSKGLMSFDLRGKTLGRAAVEGTFGIAVRDVPLERLHRLRDDKTELVVFLRRTVQGFSYEGKMMDTWPLRNAAGGHWAVPLSSPDVPLISAGRGTVIADAAALKAVCSASMRPMGVPSYPAPPKAYLSVAPDAPLVKALGKGAPKHLIVPAAAFPSAPKTAPAPR